MDLRIFLAVACVLGSASSVPVPQLNTARNFIPDRYDIRGELINNDGTFSRQDPPEEEEQPLYDQFGGYQQSNDYGQYGQQAYSNFQEPGEQYNMGGQGQQSAFFNPQQDLTNDMPAPSSEEDDINPSNTQQESFFNQQQQPQQFQNFNDQPPPVENQGFNDQPPPVENQGFNDQPPPVESQQGFFGMTQQQSYPQQFNYQPQAQESDELRGIARDQSTRKDDSPQKEEDDLSKRDEILRQRIRKFEIPRNLKRKDLAGMLGFGKQVYLRGGH